MTVLALAAMVLTMFATGLGLHGRDFLRLRTEPGAIVIGLVLQAVLLPVAMILLLKNLLPVDFSLFFGLGLAALAPATAASHVFVGLAGGNIGVARSLTAWSSVIFLVILTAMDLARLLPGLWLVLGLGYVLPLVLGMALVARQPQIAIRAERGVFMAASVLTGVVILGTLYLHWHVALIGQFGLALVVCLIAALFGGLAGGLGRSGKGQAIGISLAMQNATVMMAICWAAGSGWFAASSAVYAIAMYLAVIGVILFWRRIG